MNPTPQGLTLLTPDPIDPILLTLSTLSIHCVEVSETLKASPCLSRLLARQHATLRGWASTSTTI